jgi:hypothetical protein
MKREKTMLRTALVFASLVTLLAVAAAPASAGLSAQQLTDAGWTCFTPLPGDNIHCAPPGGLERLMAGAPTMTFSVFRASNPDEFLGTEFIIRSDLFAGQPCPTDPPSKQYTYLGPILGLDYYACHRYDSSF